MLCTVQTDDVEQINHIWVKDQVSREQQSKCDSAASMKCTGCLSFFFHWPLLLSIHKHVSCGFVKPDTMPSVHWRKQDVSSLFSSPNYEKQVNWVSFLGIWVFLWGGGGYATVCGPWSRMLWSDTCADGKLITQFHRWIHCAAIKYNALSCLKGIMTSTDMRVW